MFTRSGDLGGDGRDDRDDRVGGLTDADLLRSTATWLRTDADGAWVAGLTTDDDVRAMTALLELLAAELPHVAPTVVRAAVDWCRAALGEPGF